MDLEALNREAQLLCCVASIARRGACVDDFWTMEAKLLRANEKGMKIPSGRIFRDDRERYHPGDGNVPGNERLRNVGRLGTLVFRTGLHNDNHFPQPFDVLEQQ